MMNVIVGDCAETMRDVERGSVDVIFSTPLTARRDTRTRERGSILAELSRRPQGRWKRRIKYV